MWTKLFSKKPKIDQTQVFQDEMVGLLKDFRQKLQQHHDRRYSLAIQRLNECLNEIRKPNISILKIAQGVKWLIFEIGTMLYDKQFKLSPDEEEVWKRIKECHGKHDTIGHGVGIGL